MTTTRLKPKPGDTVKAFHPGMMGVIKTGTVVKRPGSKYTLIDFGELLGGRCKVANHHVTEIVDKDES